MTLPCTHSPDDWFATDPATVAAAVAACRTCPAVAACAELGQTEQWGVWGATTPADRVRVADGELFPVAAAPVEERHDRAAYVAGRHADCARCRAANAQWISEWRQRGPLSQAVDAGPQQLDLFGRTA